MAIQKFNAVDGFSTGLTMTNVIDSAGNISGVAGTFTGVFNGATGAFSKLLTLNGGLSASHLLVGVDGATFSGNISASSVTVNSQIVSTNARGWFL